MNPEEQLDLFLKRETKQRAQEQSIQQATLIQNSIRRIKSCIQCQPEINHSCSTRECHPVNEDYLIRHGRLRGPPLHNDVFVCHYGRVHICNEIYRECIIEVDPTGQGTCRISGRYYGLSSFNMVSTKADQHDIGGGGYYSDDNEDDGDYDYDAMGASSYHPFNQPSSLVQTICNPTSRFIEKVEPTPDKRPPAVAVKTPQFAIGGVTQATTTTTMRTTTITTTTVASSSKMKKNAAINSMKTTRKKPASAVSIQLFPPASTAPALPSLLHPSAASSLPHPNKVEQSMLRMQIIKIMDTLLYSQRRVNIAYRELTKCLENGRKAISNDLRLISAAQQKRRPVIVPLFDLFVTYIKHVTIHYTMLQVAPIDEAYVERTVALILQQWHYVTRYLTQQQIPITEKHFTCHCLAIMYEMRKGGRQLANTQLIPDCEYTRTYIPAIELLDQFGYKKNFITQGFKHLIHAYK